MPSMTSLRPSDERSSSICRARRARFRSLLLRTGSPMRGATGQCLPLVAQDGHHVSAGEPAALVSVVAQGALVNEARLLVRTTGSLVLGPHVEPDALQAKLPEAEVDQRVDRVGPIALSPLARLADEDADLRASVGAI